MLLGNRENRKVAMLLYDYLGVVVKITTNAIESIGGIPMNTWPPRRAGFLRRLGNRLHNWLDGYEVMRVWLDVGPEKRIAFLTMVLASVRIDDSFNVRHVFEELGVPSFSSARELKMKLELRGCMG